jgi:hypothetical protein
VEDGYYIFEDRFLGWTWSDQLIYSEENEVNMYTIKQIDLFIKGFYAQHGYEMDDSSGENKFNTVERKNIAYLRRLREMIETGILKPSPSSGKFIAGSAVGVTGTILVIMFIVGIMKIV